MYTQIDILVVRRDPPPFYINKRASRWWKKTMRSVAGLELAELTTTRAYNNPGNSLYGTLKPFAGGHVILAIKK